MDPKSGSPSSSDAENEAPSPPHNSPLSQIVQHKKALPNAQSQNNGCTETECRTHADIEAINESGGQSEESLQEHITEIIRVPAATDKGKGGVENPDKPVEIIVNHFPVVLEEKPTFIYRYAVSLFPSCESKAVKRRLKTLLQEGYFGGELISHDGGDVMFIAESTLAKKDCHGRTDFEFMITPWAGERAEYKLNLKKKKTISDNGLREFLRGYEPKPPSDYLSALDVVLKDGPSSLPFAFRKIPYYLDDELVTLKLRSDGDPIEDGGGNISSFSIWALKGFTHSLRSVKRGLTLNLDSVSMAFHARKCLIHYLQGRGIDPWTLLHSQEQMDKAKRMLVGLYIDVMHSPTKIYRKYRITGISAKPASDTYYILRDNGDQVYVADYYQTMYYVTITVDPSLPCVVVRSDGEDSYRKQEHDHCSHDPNHLPMELCFIAKGQKFVGDSNINKTLNQLAGLDAMGRYQTIQQNVKFLNNLFKEQVIDNEKFRSLKPFGIEIGEEMMSVAGRLIPEPRLEPNVVRSELCRGKWRLETVLKPGQPLRDDEWDVILFSPSANAFDQVKAMMNDIFSTFSRFRINCFGDHAGQDRTYYLRIDPSNLESSEAVEAAFRLLMRDNSSKLTSISFLFIFFEDKLQSFFYETMKRICEIELGWITKCCIMNSRSIRCCRISTTQNIALMVNIKLGGVNTALMENEFLDSLFGSEDRVILFGIHILRNSSEISTDNIDMQSGHTERSRESTLVAMVGSMEWRPVPGKYYARVRLLPGKPNKAEIADSLCAMAKELLETHIDENQGKMPTRAIFFMDGVSDGQFKCLVDKQFLPLKQALQSICPEIKASLIVSQRTYNTRFFIKKRDEDGNEVIQNLEVGTAVDKDITQPELDDFYLLSESTNPNYSLHQPTHYVLLQDENNLKKNLEGLERFVFYLCYTYVKHTHTVPIVPPILYAEKAASHARAWYPSAKSGDDLHLEPHLLVRNTMYFI